MVALAAIEGEEVGEAALAYINRLSDYLFVAARAPPTISACQMCCGAPAPIRAKARIRPKTMSDREDQRTMRFVRPRPVIASVSEAIQG